MKKPQGAPRPGEVIEAVGRRVRVRFEDGTAAICPFRGQVVVGDKVVTIDGVVTEIAERDTELMRTGSEKARVLCANATVLLSVSAAMDPPFRPGLVDRVLVAAGEAEMDAAVVLNKCDLGMPEEVLERLACYEDLGYRIFMVSAAQNKGLESLQDFLKGQTAVMVGHSGVGKTSLLAALVPGIEREIGGLDAWGRGRHTTTGGLMLDVPTGGRIIDLPGVREFGLGHIPYKELKHYFPEFDGMVCRYSDCVHGGDDGCVAPGKVDEIRLASYQKLLEELKAGGI